MGVSVGQTDGRTRWWTCPWGIRSASGAVMAADRCGGRSPAALASCTSAGWRRGLAVTPVPDTSGCCDGAPAEEPHLSFFFCAPVGTLPAFGVAPSVRLVSSSVRGLGPSRVGWGCSRGGALSLGVCDAGLGLWLPRPARRRTAGASLGGGVRVRALVVSMVVIGASVRRAAAVGAGEAEGEATAVVATRLYYIVCGGCVPADARMSGGWYHTLRLSAVGRPVGRLRHHPRSVMPPPSLWSAGTSPSPPGHPNSGRHPHPPSYCTAGRCRRLPISIAICGMAVTAGRSCHAVMPWHGAHVGAEGSGAHGPHATRTASLAIVSVTRLFLSTPFVRL